MKSDKKIAIMVTAIIAVSIFAAISATQANGQPAYPEPDLAWENINSTGDVTDVAIGNLTGNGIADVAFIDNVQPSPSPPPTVYAVYGTDGTEYWHNYSVYGYSIAVGDVDDDGKNEVVAGGYNDNESKPGITVFEDDGTFKFFYETDSATVTDIEIGDIDNDGTNDIIACDPFDAGWIYVINSTGGNVTGWPKGPFFGAILDIAIGNLDGIGGLDIAAISNTVGDGTLYAFGRTGNELWPPNTTVRGRSVEIGDVDGDNENEVVIGDYESGNVYVYDGATGTLEYSFDTGGPVAEIELGDLDGDTSDLEIAALHAEPATLYALKAESGNPNLVEMWNYSINWHTKYYGEGLAIGDVDRDYKNEVIAASTSENCYIYAFDGIDSNEDGYGDVVWMYNLGPTANDIEVGDIDGDGDMDVIVGTNGGDSVYALSTQEHTAVVEGETIFFDSDPSNITEVASVDMPPDPPSGYNFPYGVFAINITVPEWGQEAIITLTLPDNLPANSVYWKYGPNGSLPPRNPNPHWYQVPLDSNDGDNVITITLQDGGTGDADGEANGVIVDQGGPATPPAQVPALTPIGIAALVGLLTIIATSVILKKRKKR